MDCSQFEQLLHDLDRPGTEGFAAREIALAHAESCSHCAQLLTRMESLDLALRALSAREAGQQAPPRIEKLLREEFRRGNAASSRRWVRWQLAALGTAAALLLALGFSLYHRVGRSSNPSTSPRGASVLPGSAGAGSASNAGPSQISAAQEEPIVQNQAADSESATNFVPLPYADDSMNGEGGAIVRVVLSRPALASLGLPVTDLGATDRIPADIIVSEDGAPQAIRLVSQSSLDE